MSLTDGAQGDGVTNDAIAISNANSYLKGTGIKS
jgi:hypothetical protein